MNFVALYLLPTTKNGKQKKTNEQNKTKQKQKKHK